MRLENIHQTVNSYSNNIKETATKYYEGIKQYSRSTALIGAGVLQVAHGGIHIIQAAQSFILASNSMMMGRLHRHRDDSLQDIIGEVLHNPYAGVAFAVTGLATLYIGIRDRKQHKQAHAELISKNERIKELESTLKEIKSTHSYIPIDEKTLVLNNLEYKLTAEDA